MIHMDPQEGYKDVENPDATKDAASAFALGREVAKMIVGDGFGHLALMKGVVRIFEF